MAVARRLALTRAQVLAYRRRVGALDARLPAGPVAYRRAAWAGLQDSMPRAAVLSLHARVEGVGPFAWADPAFVQLWGPRYSVFVVPAEDRALFTLGRLPDTPKDRAFAEAVADELEAFLAERAMSYAAAGRAMGDVPNRLRYAGPTGRVLLRWDGARRPDVWMVPAPDVDPGTARLELTRRYLHVYGPTTAASFGIWAGIRPATAESAFDALAPELVPVSTPIGDAWLLASDEAAARADPPPPAPARLLPSGDAFYLLQNADRDLLVPDPALRERLWTSRVWPGALLLAGEVAGTWRRAGPAVTVEPWRDLTPLEREAVEAEGAALPVPALAGRIRVRFAG